MAERIQLRRTKGWRKPEGAITVARPSKWGNPFTLRGSRWVIGPYGNEYFCEAGEQRGVAVRFFRESLMSGHLDISIEDIEAELRGHDLACWCPLDQPCHADVLLSLANQTQVAG